MVLPETGGPTNGGNLTLLMKPDSASVVLFLFFSIQYGSDKAIKIHTVPRKNTACTYKNCRHLMIHKNSKYSAIHHQMQTCYLMNTFIR